MATVTLEDQGGNRITRIGKAGVQRALMKPVRVTCDAKSADYAMVRCCEKDIYICRDGKGQRNCTFHVTWWEDPKDYDSEKVRDFEVREKAITFFLKLVKDLYA